MTTAKVKGAPGKAGRTATRNLSTLEGEIERLHGSSINELRLFWARRFRRHAPPIQSADLLHRLIAWKIQVEAFGDLDAKSWKEIKRQMRTSGAEVPALINRVHRLKAGTVLVREWRGVVHRVLVHDDGFEHRDKRYRSLTQVARAIAKTRWSGPRFFGLENASSQKAAIGRARS